MPMPDPDLAFRFLKQRLGDESGWLFLGYKVTEVPPEQLNGRKEPIKPKSFHWPKQRDDVRAWIEKMIHTHPLYWCPFLRIEDKRAKGNAVSRRWLWADLDGPAGNEDFITDLRPIQIASGRPGNRHLYVPLKEELDNDEWHRLARALRDTIGGDIDPKITDNDYMRLPGVLNFRTTPHTRADYVTDKAYDKPVRRSAASVEALISSVSPATSRTRDDNGERVTGAERVNWARLPDAVRAAFDRDECGEGTGRFRRTYRLVTTCREKGYTAGQTYAIVREYAPAVEKFGRRLQDQVKTIWNKTEKEKPTPPEDGRRLILTSAASIATRRQTWLWTDRIPNGALSLVVGREDTGKSAVCIDLAARLTKGTVEGEHYGKPRSVIYVASEDSWEFGLKPRLVAANADLDRVFRIEGDRCRRV